MINKNLCPDEDKPRERARKFGLKTLSSSELLALIMTCGHRDASATQLARNLLVHFGSLRAVLEAELSELMSLKGIGTVKALQIQAVTAINERYFEQSLERRPIIDNNESLKRYASLRFRGLKNEQFAVLLLNNHLQLLSTKTLFTGTVNQTSIHPRVLVQACLAVNAVYVVLVHNHPSGYTYPSSSDIELTKRLKMHLDALEIHIIDHLIVGDTVYSFAEHGKI